MLPITTFDNPMNSMGMGNVDPNNIEPIINKSSSKRKLISLKKYLKNNIKK